MSKKNRPGFITNMAYGKGKILDKGMYMSDNDNKADVIEDTLSRNKKHKEWAKDKIMGWENLLKPEGNRALSINEFPKLMIARFTYLSTLTHAEYERLKEDENEARFREEEEYAKEHPMEKEKIEKLQEAFNELNKTLHNNLCTGSCVSFDIALDPIKYIGKEAYDFNVYNELIDSFHKKYFEKWADDETKQAYKENGWFPYSTDDEL